MIGLNLLPQIIVDSLSVNEFKCCWALIIEIAYYMILHKYKWLVYYFIQSIFVRKYKWL